MKIEREIREKVSEQDGVTFYNGKIITIELNDDEIEQAYLLQWTRYLKEDIRTGIMNFCEDHDISPEIADGLPDREDLIARIMRKYEEDESGDISRNNMITEAVREVMKEAGIWKTWH